LLGRPGIVALVNPWIVERVVGTTLLSYGEVVEYVKRLPDAVHRQAELRRLLGEITP
jgi:hypothetical protein